MFAAACSPPPPPAKTERKGLLAVKNAKPSLPKPVEWLLPPLGILTAVALVVLSMSGFYRSAYPVRFRDAVLTESARNDIPPSLIFAVIRTESGFDPQAQSSIPARGLMQITQDTFEWAQFRLDETTSLHFDDLFETALNIRYGSAILRLLLDEFGAVETALCAYHAGWGVTKQWLRNPDYSADGIHIRSIPYEDTRRYVDKVLSTQKTYKTLYTMQ